MLPIESRFLIPHLAFSGCDSFFELSVYYQKIDTLPVDAVTSDLKYVSLSGQLTYLKLEVGIGYNALSMWTKLMNRPRKRAPKNVAVIDPDRCFGAFACSICQAACPVEDCIVEEQDANGRWVCAVLVDKCIGCGLCVTLGNPTAPQPRDFGCPPDYDAINMMTFDDVVGALENEEPTDATT